MGRDCALLRAGYFFGICLRGRDCVGLDLRGDGPPGEARGQLLPGAGHRKAGAGGPPAPQQAGIPGVLAGAGPDRGGVGAAERALSAAGDSLCAGKMRRPAGYHRIPRPAAVPGAAPAPHAGPDHHRGRGGPGGRDVPGGGDGPPAPPAAAGQAGTYR